MSFDCGGQNAYGEDRSRALPPRGVAAARQCLAISVTRSLSARAFKARTVGATKVVTRTTIPADWECVDIGPETTAEFTKILLGAKTVCWNGPVGVFEIDTTAKGTIAVAEALAKATAAGATTIIGGGDSASAVKKAGVAIKVSHVSTGGGAPLECLEAKVLPGVAALTDK